MARVHPTPRSRAWSHFSQVIPAHGPGVKAPSIHNGVPVLQGVRALCLRANNTELCSGGSDGIVLCWDLAGGSVGRIVKKIEVAGGCRGGAAGEGRDCKG